MGCKESKTKAPLPFRGLCSAGSECSQRHSSEHVGKFCHPGDTDFPLRKSCRNGEDCPFRLDQAHCWTYCHPGDEDYTGVCKVCVCGLDCRDLTARHRRRFSHPQGRRACRFGLRCWRQSDDHTADFAHPGDKDYRRGLVVFDDDVGPEFSTLRQLFDYCDPNEHGNFATKEDFLLAVPLLEQYRSEHVSSALDADRAWKDLEGERNDFVGFAKFAAWAPRASICLPVGVDMSSAASMSLKCGFVHPDGTQCECENFRAAGSTSGDDSPPSRAPPQHLCVCGHKRSMHSESCPGGMLRTLSSISAPEYWSAEDGQVFLDEGGKALFQMLFDRTHKESDNWTRDRGCGLHGRACPADDPMCTFRNKCEVPTGYRVVAVARNMRREQWGYYVLNRSAVEQECAGASEHPFRVASELETFEAALEEESPLTKECNEWFLFHGTSPKSCESICASNFRVSMAGTGATWRDHGAGKGMPLYGPGMYFADRITKADEYSEMVEAGRRFAGCHTVLVCRVLGGRAQYCDTNEIDAEFLQKQVISGPFHSVLGDRVSKLKKPFREVVVYDSTQVYPEYLVYYRRLYG